MTRALTATYRLQLRREFPLPAARELVPYLHRLGVSHVYLSPILAARPGSPHGYDVIDHARVNPELGTAVDLTALAHELHARSMGIILDIVPNHMAASETNRYWDDVLERGRASRFAEWFDIDWDAPQARGRVILPVLGDELDRVLDRGELRPRIRDSGARLEYEGRTFPVDPATLPREMQLALWDPAGRPAADDWAAGSEGKSRLRALLGEQHYRLVFWRDASEINYRRFFDVNDLVALRMETDEVFDATHKLVLSWVREGIVDGLRVDHVDGLSRPSWYLAKLRESVDAARPAVAARRDHPERSERVPAHAGAAGERFPIFVEKILSGDETLPHEWPVEGTTGYDFMNDVEELFLDPGGFEAIEANYRALRHNPSLAFGAVAKDGKRRALTGSLCPDVQHAARLADRWRALASESDLAKAIVALIVHLDVYRTYVSEPGIMRDADREALTRAFTGAREHDDVSRTALDLLHDAFFAEPTPGDTPRTELVLRLQQLSAPAMAKGVEDTALYVYIPLASRNEVGGQPDRPLKDAQRRAHARNSARASDWPRSMLASNTHDTKRSADLRARLDALTAAPDAWARHAARWRRLNKPRKRIVRGKPAPDTNSEYLYYQMLLGLWPAPRPERRVDDLPDADWIERARDRLATYMLKAAREAKTRTSWTDADTQYEKALEAFVRETLQPEGDAPLLPDVARLTAQVAERGFRLSLARVLLLCVCPGTPDIYQGDEIWSFTLVDPDNRRPVDFPLLKRLLEESESESLQDALDGGSSLYDNRVKLGVLSRLLRYRRDHAKLFSHGDYLPLSAEGVFAFARRYREEMCLAVARTRPAPPGKTVESQESIELPDELAGQWHSVLTGRAVGLLRSGRSLSVRVGDLITSASPCELLGKASG